VYSILRGATAQPGRFDRLKPLTSSGLLLDSFPTFVLKTRAVCLEMNPILFSKPSMCSRLSLSFGSLIALSRSFDFYTLVSNFFPAQLSRTSPDCLTFPLRSCQLRPRASLYACASSEDSALPACLHSANRRMRWCCGPLCFAPRSGCKR
jgi:hypothetical protein